MDSRKETDSKVDNKLPSLFAIYPAAIRAELTASYETAMEAIKTGKSNANELKIQFLMLLGTKTNDAILYGLIESMPELKKSLTETLMIQIEDKKESDRIAEKMINAQILEIKSQTSIPEYEEKLDRSIKIIQQLKTYYMTSTEQLLNLIPGYEQDITLDIEDRNRDLIFFLGKKLKPAMTTQDYDDFVQTRTVVFHTEVTQKHLKKVFNSYREAEHRVKEHLNQSIFELNRPIYDKLLGPHLIANSIFPAPPVLRRSDKEEKPTLSPK